MILDAIACAVGKAGIAIGTYYVVQAYIKCSLLDRDNACSVIYQLIVAKLIAYQLRTCYNHVLFVFACISSVAPALVSSILSVSFIAYACAILQAYLIAVDDAVLLQTYIAVCFQAFLATVFRAGINIIQVNLARQNIRYAMNCRCCTAYTIILEFIITYKAVIKLNACLPIVGSLIISTLFIPNSNNTCILVILDFILRISDNYLTVQLFLHSVVEAFKSINAQCIVMVFQQIAIRSVNSITGNIEHLFCNSNITHGKVITQVVGAYFAAAGNLPGPQPAAVDADILQFFALQQAVVVLISRKGIVSRIICSKLAAINPAMDIKMICRIINPTLLQVRCYRNLGQENLQQRVSAFIVKLPGCFLIIKSIAVQLLCILAVFSQRAVCLNDIAFANSATIYVCYVGVAIYFIAINIAYLACIAAHNVCHIAIACYRSSAISVAQLAFSRITANDTADIASAADCTAIGISIIIKLSAISISCACFGLGYCYYAVEHLVQRAAVSTGDTANVAALSCIDHTGVIACRQRAAVIAKQTADVFSWNRCSCNSTVCCIIGACLNRTIVINLILIIIVLIIATTGDNTIVDANDTTDICYTADITIYSVHQGGIADIRANGIYTDNTACTVFLLAAVIRSIAMHFALIFHDDMGNICTVFTDDAASTTSQSNNGTGVDNTYALFGSTGNGYFIFADNAADIVLADNKAFIAVAHAQKLACLAAFACVFADNTADIGSLRSIHSGSVGRIGNDAHVFTGNAAEELGVRCNYRVAL